MSMAHPSGEQFTISSSGYEAVITSVGASLRSLTFNDKPMIDSFLIDEIRPAFHGAPLAPWPNRIADGRYTFRGQTYQVALTEPERGNALHGLVCWDEWSFEQGGADSVRLSTVIAPQAGYPHRVKVTTEYLLSGSGLVWTVTAQNLGGSVAPVGLGTHAYLRPNTGAVDDWSLVFPAAQVLDVDPHRLLPRQWHSADSFPPSAPFGFASGKGLDGMVVDHCFSLIDGQPGVAKLTNIVTGEVVTMTWDATLCPWVQVCTSDFDGTSHLRTGLAVEPVTCPPNGFNSGDGVAELGPGEELSISLSLSCNYGEICGS
ncbi:aldose 1-epimerase family protein [Corynebacterium cystitidis]|uniref:aldose 1-epimerase family protein n=1 Tax=Corynebacterium cystitidis TaxID=35757 RepID=UPI00211DEFFE|nr:aldose 1-epimerase family protein [Corynebacterium cystitidis]